MFAIFYPICPVTDTRDVFFLDSMWAPPSRHNLYLKVVTIFWCPFPSQNKNYTQYSPPLLIAGTTLFSGSLYLMVVRNKKALGAVTSVGGLILTAG